MNRLLPLLLLLLSFSTSAGLFDQRPSAELGSALNNSSDFLPVAEAFKARLVERNGAQIKLQIVNADGYYLYRHRFAVKAEPANLALGELQLPAGKEKEDPYFGKTQVFYGITDLSLDVPVQTGAFTLLLTYQGCADKGLCYPPETARLAIPAADGSDPSDSALASSTANLAAAPDSAASEPISLHKLLLFFAAGLALTFTPCVLPMLPILSGVVLRGQLGGWRGFSLSVAYVLPMAASFAALGALMGLFGAELNLQARLQSPWVLVPFALFFALFALAMFGLFELRLPHRLSSPLDNLAGRTRGGSILGAALLGVLSSLLVSPCVSAVLASLLLYIGASGDVLGGAAGLFVLGLGMGAPLVLFAVGGGALLPKSGPWLETVRNGFGVMLLAVAIWLLDRILPGPLTLALWALLAAGVAIFLGTLEFSAKNPPQKLAQLIGLALLTYALAAGWGALQGATDPLRPLQSYPAAAPQSAAAGAWRTLSDPQQLKEALAQAQANNQPLLLDWYADWCVSCKVLERDVFSAPQVQSELKHWQLVRLDITDNRPEQRALLDQYRLFGPPAILLFNAAGQELKAARIIGEIKAEAFAKHLAKAR